jgi:hypothetical protein
MLLIAIPKAATTSLACTLKEITGLYVHQGIAKVSTDIDCEGFTELQKYHTNMIERSGLFLHQVITGRKKIFKEHLLPTKRHLKYLEKYKVPIAIILREVDHVYDAYQRHDAPHYKKHGIHIDLKKIKNDIKKFHDTYLHWASNKPNVKIFYYKDLILNYKPTMNSILKHYRLPIPKTLKPLQQLKFTGIGLKRLKNVTNSTTEKCKHESNVDDITNTESIEKERTES